MYSQGLRPISEISFGAQPYSWPGLVVLVVKMTAAAAASRRRHYPFAAIIGQEDLKLCLILCAIDPSIGGVLIRGDKGTAKSTAARGIAALLPKIDVGYDPKLEMLDPYNQRPSSLKKGGGAAEAADGDGATENIHQHHHDDDDGAQQHQRYTESRHIETPFIDLPIGATEDRVLGSIDFSLTLKHGGKPIFAPGLLAAANRGILYVDEVNLLPPHLVDNLLDSAAMGVNTVQREGMTMTHPANFMLIGTMNGEEGELRPQLVDRFGLMVDVTAPSDVVLRSQVVRQRIAFERDREKFRMMWDEAEGKLMQDILAAKERLSEVVLSDDLLLLISRICTELRVGSLRADITMYKAATTLAAWEGRRTAEAEDVRRAAVWVLAHRRRGMPFDSTMNDDSMSKNLDNLIDEFNTNAQLPQEQQESESSSGDQHGDDGDERKHENSLPEGTSENQQEDSSENTSIEGQRENRTDHDGHDNGNDNDNGNNNNGNGNGQMQTFTASKPGQIKQLRLSKQQKSQSGIGRRNHSSNNTQKTRYIRSIPTDKPTDLALDATLRSAASNGLSKSTGQPIIHAHNLRKKVYHNPTGSLIIFVVDASGSMAARKRMELIKGTVLALLRDAYQQRDRVCVIAFRGVKAEILLEPTRSVELAEKQMQRLPTGGRTPLAHALLLTHDTVHRLLRLEPDQSILLIVMSDGKANVPLPSDSSSSTAAQQQSGDAAWVQTEQVAMRLARLVIPTLLLDTDAGHVRVGRGKELGELLNADYLRLEDFSEDGKLVHTIRQAVVG